VSGPTPSHVRLRVRDGQRARAFWEGVLGLPVHEEDGELRLTTPGRRDPLVILEVDPGAAPAAPRTSGLFHVALRVPGRPQLGAFYRRLRRLGHPLLGAADHGVSEALYLQDGEGNGVEVYADRPPETWQWRDGSIRMVTEPLDGVGLVEAADVEGPLPEGTVVGHVHIRTADLPAAGAFWTDEVGLGVTTREWPGALFLASDGYHHHLGVNTWGGPLTRADPGAAGLVETVWRAPGRDQAAVLEDPDGHRVLLLPPLPHETLPTPAP
jgi:catechol 2,3-dioxygenase